MPLFQLELFIFVSCKEMLGGFCLQTMKLLRPSSAFWSTGCLWPQFSKSLPTKIPPRDMGEPSKFKNKTKGDKKVRVSVLMPDSCAQRSRDSTSCYSVLSAVLLSHSLPLLSHSGFTDKLPHPSKRCKNQFQFLS